MGNITGNHDMPRFLYYAGGSYRQGEDEKEAGWNHEIKVEDPKGYARLKMLHAFIMTIPGIPVVYYGDEIGMTGANDPDNRRMMRFSGLSPEEASVKQTVTKLGNLRKNSMPLIYGSTKVLQASKDQLVYIRSYFGKSVVVALNRSASAVNLDVTLPAGTATKSAEAFNQSKTSVKDNKLSMTVQPLSFEIITLQ
jgi:glycosidase